MGRFLTFLIVLALLGYGAWYMFFREEAPPATDPTTTEPQQPEQAQQQPKSMLPSGEAPQSTYGRAYNYSKTTATQANDQRNEALEAQLNSM